MHLNSYISFAVRLVNTSGRKRAPQPTGSHQAQTDDRLQTLADLRAMLATEPNWRRLANEDDVAPMRALRGELRTIFEDAAVGEESAAVRRINVLLSGVRIVPRVSGHDGHDWHLHLAEGAATAYEGFSAATMLGVAFYVSEHGFTRLGTCQSTSCPNVFIDTSTNRSRRYCSDRCATRANVAAYRARQRAQVGGGP